MKQIVTVIFLASLITGVFGQGRFKTEPVFALHYPIFPSTITLGEKEYKNLEASLASYYRGSLGGTLNRSLGFQVEIPILSKLSIRVGAAYAPKDFTGDRATPCACNAETAKEPIMFKQRYVDVPLSFRYYFYVKRTFVFAEAGGVLNVLTMYKTQFISHNVGIVSTSVSSINDIRLSNFMIGVSAGGGVGYACSPVVDLILSANCRQVLTEYTPTDSYLPRAIVLNLGLSIKIGKEK